ncbi:hypothetical protein NQ315_005825 [Exocentrus adspersus]|uniref:NOL1/NOP2/Sun domain family member 4 n=1 Tax=Exocentrus adspersus TaxID=1586481 RepID=A0AAV8VQZ3_9CUCU|nr:hypothetical protein NQ315_005825 [Exocentrus adspersus]
MFSSNSKNMLKQLNKDIRVLVVRYKNHPNHWSILQKKVHPVDKALSHFDDFYKQVYDKQWLSIRDGLLGTQKYVAVINTFGDSEESMAKLELGGAINMRTLFKLEKQHIEDKLAKNKRFSRLKQILDLDKLSEQQEENSAPENDGTNTETSGINAREFSLENSLDNAEYDTKRLVDIKNVLSTEILHEFVPATKIKGREDFILESSHYKLYDNNSRFNVQVEKEYDIDFPEHLNVYCYEAESESTFQSAKKSVAGVLNYYLMDGGSVLPVLALNLKPGHRMLDMCAAPGGKSLLALQSLYPECIVSNDVSQSRLNRIDSVFRQFLYDFDERWLNTGRIRLTKFDGRFVVEDNFDRILVDVPCTTDRHSLHNNDNNIFKPSRIKERLQIPKLQQQLLFNALKLVRKGGIVVYSTCSLSPIQNDGVVHMVLKQIWEETNMEVIVKDLSPALLQTKHVFKFADKKLLKYGHLVLPCLAQNYGPTYFCKLQRVK